MPTIAQSSSKQAILACIIDASYSYTSTPAREQAAAAGRAPRGAGRGGRCGAGEQQGDAHARAALASVRALEHLWSGAK